jgi:DNA polymerase V
MPRPKLVVRPLTVGRPVVVHFASSAVRAGFPSPAGDYHEAPLDLNDKLAPNPAATFLVRVDGDSMLNVGIFPGDLLVVDKSAEPRDGSIVIAVVNNEFTLKRLRHGRDGTVTLIAENPDYPPIAFIEGDEMYVWGVVRHVIRDV